MRSQLGKSWAIVNKSSSSSTPKWYCSLLVWAAYYNQGIDLDYNGGTYVWSNDIVNSSQTTYINITK